MQPYNDIYGATDRPYTVESCFSDLVLYRYLELKHVVLGAWKNYCY